MVSAIDIRRKRLLYLASYRGFKEADLLFGSFAKAHLHLMSEDELDSFEALMCINDHDLYSRVTGKGEPLTGVYRTAFSMLKKFTLSRMRNAQY